MERHGLRHVTRCAVNAKHVAVERNGYAYMSHWFGDFASVTFLGNPTLGVGSRHLFMYTVVDRIAQVFSGLRQNLRQLIAGKHQGCIVDYDAERDEHLYTRVTRR